MHLECSSNKDKYEVILTTNFLKQKM